MWSCSAELAQLRRKIESVLAAQAAAAMRMAPQASFFTDMLFAKEGKYGSYGGVDEVAVSGSASEALSTPTGGSQLYRRVALKFSVLTCTPHMYTYIYTYLHTYTRTHIGASRSSSLCSRVRRTCMYIYIYMCACSSSLCSHVRRTCALCSHVRRTCASPPRAHPVHPSPGANSRRH